MSLISYKSCDRIHAQTLVEAYVFVHVEGRIESLKILGVKFHMTMLFYEYWFKVLGKQIQHVQVMF